ncbi:MAG TPA: DUF4186 domain-containing protein, partial [Tepidisphaeraceae bacterium]|nr:DUF4186 domain-containing protein [Tepidisphaeraceae bacterium]
GLKRSAFRSRFRLKEAEARYLRSKGMEVVLSHARDLVAQRLAPARPTNDGRQTPMGRHPVFVAQHATGTCCRGCLEKWHGIPQGRELTKEEQEYVVRVIERWLRQQGVEEEPGLFGG